MGGDRLSSHIAELEDVLSNVLNGKPGNTVHAEGFPAELVCLAGLVNDLSAALNETLRYTKALARGNINTDAPGRNNYLAAPLKEVQSQLRSLNWNINQLLNGKIVSDLMYPGELFKNYNKLLAEISAVLSGDADVGATSVGDANSWRYHQLLNALNHVHIMVIEVDENGLIVFANRPAKEYLQGVTNLTAELPGLREDPLIDYIVKRLRKRATPATGEIFDQDKQVWYSITSNPVRLIDGRSGYLHMIEDVSEQKKRESSLKKDAMVDAMTGALNRNAGIMGITELLNQAERTVSCAIFVDIDGLKTINDQHGHRAGDFAIRSVAQALLSVVRDGDIVSRFGGDEFLVLLRGCNAVACELVIKRMYQKLAEINLQANKPYTVSFSHGFVEITPEIKDVKQLIDAIDKLMYQHKSEKKGDE